MKYEELCEFLTSKMKLSHVYQPILIKTLIESGGSATTRQLAIALLSQDESQIMLYEKRFRRYPMHVLSKHGIIAHHREFIHLNVEKLDLEQRAELKRICEEKIEEYVVARGIAVWDYSILDDNPLPQSLRYRVLKEAKGRCALCGATRDEATLEIDHIRPRSRRGKTIYSNLQALCTRCNSSKQDKDETDFRSVIGASSVKGCVFCEAAESGEKLFENSHAYVMLDRFPVSKGHTLIIPKRHFRDYFEITKLEQDEVFDLMRERQKQLLEEDHTIQGFNIGVNQGEVAGQTVFHCHTHLIPRRVGDTDHPRGGIRGVIPSKMNYPPEMT